MSYTLREIDARLRGACQVWPTSPVLCVTLEDFRSVVIKPWKRGDLLVIGDTDNRYVVSSDGRCGCPAGCNNGACYHLEAINRAGGVDGVRHLFMLQESTRESIRMSADRQRSGQREEEVRELCSL